MKTNKNSEKREAGRPKLPDDKRREHRVFVSFTGAEFEEVTLKANRHGLPLSAWLRSVSLFKE